MTEHPINDITWRPIDELTRSDYNPNHLATSEMKLLAQSLLEDGWTQPIVTREDGKIVDGHHRYRVACEYPSNLQQDGCVPCVILNNLTEADDRISTIRHNRASGAHLVEGMANNVKYLLQQADMTNKEIANRVGMEEEEINRLSRSVELPDMHDDTDFERAWKPQGEQ